MTRTILIIILMAVMSAGGLFIGPHIAANKGYVLISVGSYVLEMTVISFVMLTLGSLVIIWFLKKVIKVLLGTFSGSRNWLAGFSSRRVEQAFRAGLLALDEGDLALAKTKLNKAKGGDFAGLELLALARIESQLGNTEQALEMWQLAHQKEESRIAATVHLCEHYLAHNDGDKAILILSNLNEDELKNSSIISQYAHALMLRKNWSTLSEKLKGWKKHLSKEQWQNWQVRAAQGTYAEIASKEGAYQLKTIWQQQPRKIRLDPANQAAYIKQLLDQAMYHDAEEALVDFQKKNVVPELLPLFKELRLPNPTAAIKKLESWLKKDTENAEMLSILGNLAYQARDFGLAEQTLQKAISLRNDKSDILLLAKVKESQQDNIGALQLYKQCTFS